MFAIHGARDRRVAAPVSLVMLNTKYCIFSRDKILVKTKVASVLKKNGLRDRGAAPHQRLAVFFNNEAVPRKLCAFDYPMLGGGGPRGPAGTIAARTVRVKLLLLFSRRGSLSRPPG